MTRLELPNVTAICIDGKALTLKKRANYELIVKYMTSCINFASVKLLMIEDPHIESAEFIKIDPLVSYSDFNQFCLSEPVKHVDTEFCLIFQEDGFVLNPELWNPAFLEYDYIGAPWPPLPPWPEPTQIDRRVGNGGFCIRSKKLLEAVKDLKAHNNEDTTIVITNRTQLEAAGIQIAPLDIAVDFSIERQVTSLQSLTTCFGFHEKCLMAEALHIISKKMSNFTSP